MKTSGPSAVDMITDGSDKELCLTKLLTRWHQKGFLKSPSVKVDVGMERWTSQMLKSTMHYWTKEENDKQRGLRDAGRREPERETFRKGEFCFVLSWK